MAAAVIDYNLCTEVGAIAFHFRGSSTSFVMAKTRVTCVTLDFANTKEVLGQPDHTSLNQGEKHTNTFVANHVGEILGLSKPAYW